MNHRQWKKAYKKHYGYNPKEVDYKQAFTQFLNGLDDFKTQLIKATADACEVISKAFGNVADNLRDNQL